MRTPVPLSLALPVKTKLPVFTTESSAGFVIATDGTVVSAIEIVGVDAVTVIEFHAWLPALSVALDVIVFCPATTLTEAVQVDQSPAARGVAVMYGALPTRTCTVFTPLPLSEAVPLTVRVLADTEEPLDGLVIATDGTVESAEVMLMPVTAIEVT
jgi:hypothetical protein